LWRRAGERHPPRDGPKAAPELDPSVAGSAVTPAPMGRFGRMWKVGA
jgi:hypothetical protein